MTINSATFIVSNTDPAKCPETRWPEFAFIGRSNVGKSSLINMLMNRKGLARTSAEPGKTQTINHFLINEKWYVVDLPGFGYAKVSRSTRKTWGPMIESYLLNRPNLLTTFILIDVRLDPQEIDLEFIDWMGTNRIPFSVTFTKADKLSKRDLALSLKKWEETLSKTWSELPPMFVTSSTKKDGREKVLAYIDSLLTSS